MLSDSELAAYAAFAGELADAARAVTLNAARAAEDKNAGGVFDPVTEADKGAERAMRALIEARYPEHGISGEEYGITNPGAPLYWSLDPIDGTRSFICGLPTWTTLIGLVEDGVPVVGLIDVPVLGERYLGYGEIGRQGTEVLRTSGCAVLGEARLATTDPYLFEGAEAEAFERVRRAARVARYGQDAYAYARLAGGGIDLVVESRLQPHDIHALVPVVRGAGGVIGDWEGGSDFGKGRVVAAATQALYDQTIETLGA